VTRGLTIFPVDECAKTPHIVAQNAQGEPVRFAWGKGARNTQEAIDLWWGRQWPDANIGLPAKPNGLVIIDIDPEGVQTWIEILAANPDIPDTVTQNTPGGGMHVIFKSPEGVTIGNRDLAPGINVRGVKGDGGYIVVAPSIHPNGKQYQWAEGLALGEIAIAPLPQSLINLLADKPRETSLPSTTPINVGGMTPYARAAFEQELDRERAAQDGQRNNTLNQSAYALGQLIGGGELSRLDVEAALIGAATSVGLAESEARATIRSGIEGGLKSPRSAPPRANGQHAPLDELMPDDDPAMPPPDVPDDDTTLATGGDETLTPADVLDYPPLPAEAWIDPDRGLGAGAWIDLYVEHAAAVSPMTPRLFHEAAALVLGSIVIARRLRVRMSYADIYPNLFVAFIAPTTLFAKTTAMDYARHKAREVAPHLLAARDSTIEALLSDLGGVEPANFHAMTEEDRTHWQAGRNFAAQRGVFADELSALLSAAGRDYNSGLIETYLKFFDCDDFYTRSTRAQGRVNVRAAYLSMLGASTPGALAAHLNTDRLWANGWWARFALLTPDTDRPAWRLPQERDEPPGLIGVLKILYGRLEIPTWPKPPKAFDLMLGTGVFEAWAAYNKAMRFDLLTPELPERLWGVYGRLPTQVLKVATILAALDWGSEDAPVIELPHIARAVSIAESWRVSAHRVVAAANQNDYTAMRGRLMRILSKAGQRGATMRDIGRAMRDKTPSEIEMTLDQMVDIGDAVLMDSKPGQSGGRPTRRYRVL
jgi:hypothetical protein